MSHKLMAHTMYVAVKSTTTTTTTANWVKKAMQGRDGRGHLHTDTHTRTQRHIHLLAGERKMRPQ